MDLAYISDWIWAGRGPWEKGTHSGVGEDPGLGLGCISTQLHVLL